MFYTCLSVILFTGGSASGHAGTHTHTHTPPGQPPHLLGRQPPSLADNPPLWQTPPPGQTAPLADGYCSGQYTSYCNAFLFHVVWYYIQGNYTPVKLKPILEIYAFLIRQIQPIPLHCMDILIQELKWETLGIEILNVGNGISLFISQFTHTSVNGKAHWLWSPQLHFKLLL